MQHRNRIALGVVCLGCGIGTYMVLNSLNSPSSIAKLQSVENLRHKSTSSYEKELQKFVAQYDSSHSKTDQDAVISAKLRLGYALAKKGDYTQARSTLLSASKNSGTGTPNPDYGTLEDQARYQAIVCLVADKKVEAARKEFLQFIKDRPTSALAIQCFRRLVRLNGGVPRKSDQEAFERADSLHQAEVQRQLASCGPLVINRLLTKLAYQVPQIEELMEECKTNESGTDLESMRRVLQRRGLNWTGYALNRQDFSKMPLPCIWMQQDHYVLVEAVTPEFALVFDPMFNGLRKEQLPPIDDRKFSAIVLAQTMNNVRSGS